MKMDDTNIASINLIFSAEYYQKPEERVAIRLFESGFSTEDLRLFQLTTTGEAIRSDRYNDVYNHLSRLENDAMLRWLERQPDRVERE